MVTRQITVTDSGTTDVAATTPCAKILVYELPSAVDWPHSWEFTSAFSTDAAEMQPGASASFSPPAGNLFQLGQVAAKLQLAAGAGTTTFVVVEG